MVPSTCDNPEDDNVPDDDVTGYRRILNGASSTFHCSGHDTKEVDAARMIAELTIEMKKAAELLQFELAAQLRDEIRRLEEQK